MSFWLSLLGYQAVWFAAVIGAGHGLVWPGVLGMLTYALAQLVLARNLRVDLGLMSAGLVFGFLLDGAIIRAGLASYASGWPDLQLAPAWILALWITFALTFSQSLRHLQQRLWLAALLGLVGGPLAYLGAARGWHVVSFAEPTWRAAAGAGDRLGTGDAGAGLAGTPRHGRAACKRLPPTDTRSVRMSVWWPLLIVWLLAAAMMTLGWQWQRSHANAGIVDVLWAAGVGGGAVLLALIGSGAPWTRAVLALLGGAWGVRLAVHLWRRMRGEPEDGRYQSLRAHWHGAQWKFFAFFQFQALLIVLFALPFVAVSRNPQASGLWLPVAGAVWLLSVDRRGDRRCATGTVPQRLRQQGPHLPRRPVALLASSELFLRMAALVCLRLPCASARRSAGWHGPARS